MATICWASTSSGLRGTTVCSISPSRMRWATTAHSSRSARNLGKIRPFETSPTPWPARPIRWRPAVTDFGDSTWSTRSTAPMSMPSSSDEVATRHGSSPDLSRSSTTSRSSRASEPWWARAMSAGSSVLAAPARSGAPPGAPRRGGCSRRRSWTGAPGPARAARGRSPARSSAGWRPARRGPCPSGRRRPQPCRRSGGSATSVRPARACPRPARGSPGRAACACRCRPSGTRGRRRPGSGRPPRAGAAWPTGRSAGPAGPPGARAARASAPGGRRAWSAPPRGSRRRSPIRVARNSRAREVSIR